MSENDDTPPQVGTSVAKQNEAPVMGTIEPIATDIGAANKPITAEIATVRRNIFMQPTYDWVLRPRDPTLRARGGGWNYEIYEQAEMDPKVFSTLQKRKGALAAYPVQVDPASESPLDVAAAELVTRALTSLNFALLTKNLLEALSRGFSVVELQWELVPGPAGLEWQATGHWLRDQRRFRFGEFARLRLLTWDNLVTGELVPDRKFVVHAHDMRDGDPYGRGLSSMLWWSAYFKRENQKAWLIHNDKFAVPTAHGTYPPDASDDEKNALFAAIVSFSTESAVMSPDGTEIKLIETARAAGGDTFKVMKDSQDEDIEQIVLGSTYAANAGGLDGGSGADTDQDDRLELAQADANDLAFTLNDSWVRWTVEFNLPGARPPKLRWLIDAEEDLTQRAERDSKIESMGFEPDIEYINKTYGGVWKKAAALAPVVTDVANFSGAGAAAPTSRVANRLVPQLAASAGPALDSWVASFRTLISQCDTLEEARDRLIELYPAMSGQHFAETMSEALQLADLAGRVDAHGG